MSSAIVCNGWNVRQHVSRSTQTVKAVAPAPGRRQRGEPRASVGSVGAFIYAHSSATTAVHLSYTVDLTSRMGMRNGCLVHGNSRCGRAELLKRTFDEEVLEGPPMPRRMSSSRWSPSLTASPATSASSASRLRSWRTPSRAPQGRTGLVLLTRSRESGAVSLAARKSPLKAASVDQE
jgi:hypothetical protein